MLIQQKQPYCIDTISTDLISSPYTGRSIVALWQEAFKATSVWLVMTCLTTAHALIIFFERNRQRKVLGALDDRLLKDIGISRTAAAHEAGKPFWRK